VNDGIVDLVDPAGLRIYAEDGQPQRAAPIRNAPITAFISPSFLVFLGQENIRLYAGSGVIGAISASHHLLNSRQPEP
jgi:hypothetical protein